MNRPTSSPSELPRTRRERRLRGDGPLAAADRAAGGPSAAVDAECAVVLQPRDPDLLARDLAESIRALALDPERRTRMGAASRTPEHGTNNRPGFDYLRDNLVYHHSERVQRPLHYAIVDEVDSILIDEARTPLIISGPADDNTELYQKLNTVPAQLTAQTVEPA